MPDHPVDRRDFVKTAATATLGAMIVPRRVLGGVGYQPPSDTLNVAIVGAGGMGMSNMTELLGENVVAVCDVDFPYVERSLAGRLRSRNGKPPSEENLKLRDVYQKAAKYADFRELLDKQKDLDAVVVATPDHAHATVAYHAMRAGKHVYVQKPLTYSVYEARLLARTAKETGVTTQMGNQGHSMEGTRRIMDWIRAGVIGPVREVHIYTDRPVRYWAQGIPRPDPEAARRAEEALQRSRESGVPPTWNMGTVDRAVQMAMAANPQTPPQGLNWDLWLGPAPEVPYHPAYHPFSWRGWVDFGGGALGDMGAHLVDQPYWALGLTQPTSIVASGSPWGGSAKEPASFPLATMVQYEFGAAGDRPPVKVYWYDSGMLPPRPPFLPDDAPMSTGDGGGGIFIGERGILMYETYGNNPRIYPEAVAREAERVPTSFPRVETGHEVNWAQACKGQTTASAPFEYSAALTETMLLGLAALRAGYGRKLLYDAPKMRFTNAPDADQFLTRVYREGWAL
ncbi:MAG TPA: Gfo/Idh/MocA family oxidoreductase [Gemmatimonadaceae bacterium]|nr:Gfo/Idh/MocA family oxidoreductase [Gemmatimonadaceae bacterium]